MNIPPGWKNRTAHIPITKEAVLEGNLTLPVPSRGLVLFVHGTGSSRFSPRNQHVAQVLQQAGFATLLIDLLTRTEEEQERFTAHLRFDIDLLTERVNGATDWISSQSETAPLRIGYFGASTGAAAALCAAAQRPSQIAAVVSRGGRPDLAQTFLPKVQAPTLLIVGSRDTPVIPLNQLALKLLPGEKRLELVEGATHLFEEPGALELVARLATDWFRRYLTAYS